MNIYRISFSLTEDCFSNTSPSNMFLRDKSNLGEEAIHKYADSLFKNELAKAGIADAKFTSTISLSSEDEVDMYKKYLLGRQQSTNAVN